VEGEKGESEKVLNFRDDKNMNNNYSLFYYAVYAGMIPIVRYLLSKGLFEINEICDQQGNTALLLATEHEDMEFVKYLVTVPSIDFTLRNKVKFIGSSLVFVVIVIPLQIGWEECH
jgi:ankyrin repeat protein